MTNCDIQIVDDLVSMIVKRAEAGKNYGVVMLPEGLIEFIPEFNALISDINDVLASGIPTTIGESYEYYRYVLYFFCFLSFFSIVRRIGEKQSLTSPHTFQLFFFSAYVSCVKLARRFRCVSRTSCCCCCCYDAPRGACAYRPERNKCGGDSYPGLGPVTPLKNLTPVPPQ